MLPTRDLSEQVHSVFRQYTQRTHLRVGLAVGSRIYKLTNLKTALQLQVIDDSMHRTVTIFFKSRFCLQALKPRVVTAVRALIVLPTRDLAEQIHSVFSQYTQRTQLRVGLAVGSRTFAQEQRALVRQGPRGNMLSCVDILIATPGRVVDHIHGTQGFTLKQLRFLVSGEQRNC